MTNKILTTINSPKDLLNLSFEDLSKLALEIREEIIQVTGRNGGHLASNLGIVELTLALHRVFDFSKDHLLFDVGHQCYTHKIITGRRELFSTLRQKDGLTGFPNPRESIYDTFVVGHASTAISSALGLSLANRSLGKSNKSVAIIGDGAIGGGMAFEALNHAGQTEADLLIILNDNEMSISETVGAFSTYLTELRTNPTTRRARKSLRLLYKTLPFGDSLEKLQNSIIGGVKSLVEANGIFSALGFRYFGPLDGHNLPLLEKELQQLKDISGPKILHVITEKGKGYIKAQQDPEKYHSAVPFEVTTIEQTSSPKFPSYTEVFSKHLEYKAEKDERIVAITAAMPSGTGVREFSKKFPDRFYDVGICEAHSITFSAALAKAGLRPVLAIYSTFLQRGYDQIMHDVICQENLPIIIAIDRAGLVGNDGFTHHGLFDIAFLRHLPGITLMSPKDGKELCLMLDFSLQLSSPVALRYPRGSIPDDLFNILLTNYHPTPISLGKAEVLTSGNSGAVFAYGRMVYPCLAAALELKQEHNLDISVINARFAKPLDKDLLTDISNTANWLAVVEDHSKISGLGSGVSEFLHSIDSKIKFYSLGYEDALIPHASISELDTELGLDKKSLKAKFLNYCLP